MISGLGHTGDEHKCSVCSCDFTDDEGGVIGYFGILPVAFCPTCYSCMVDMVSQDLGIGDEE
jgi:transposase-like protein